MKGAGHHTGRPTSNGGSPQKVGWQRYSLAKMKPVPFAGVPNWAAATATAATTAPKGSRRWPPPPRVASLHTFLLPAKQSPPHTGTQCLIPTPLPPTAPGVSRCGRSHRWQRDGSEVHGRLQMGHLGYYTGY
mmetsp:Transcript_61160/g.109095  ORF Transcript_61160/g.109095 Transcript_61160/m.109095 type:complete len:132 (-) Transcript_61160:86-481(-)